MAAIMADGYTIFPTAAPKKSGVVIPTTYRVQQFNSYITSKTKSRAPIGPIKRQDGGLAIEESDMAAELNKFFASVFTKEDQTNLPTKIERPTSPWIQ
jgi:hypothetical protein